MRIILALATVNLGPSWFAEVPGSCCLCFSWKVCTETGGTDKWWSWWLVTFPKV